MPLRSTWWWVVCQTMGSIIILVAAALGYCVGRLHEMDRWDRKVRGWLKTEWQHGYEWAHAEVRGEVIDMSVLAPREGDDV